MQSEKPGKLALEPVNHELVFLLCELCALSE